MALRGVAVALAALLVCVHGQPQSTRKSADFFRRRFFPGYSAPAAFDLPSEQEVYPEWFDVDEAKDCENVPDSVNTGKPANLCDGGNVGERFCICVKTTRYHPYQGSSAIYAPICGECRDPCALRFIPDKYPKRSDNDDNDDDYDDN